mmetsp:Transcript_8382/g.17391  ORF Transcript_8382/g.17391 Transcript_8382/m.17391 type:complete len:129 (-) Transcript_8382:881-1267(-)
MFSRLQLSRIENIRFEMHVTAMGSYLKVHMRLADALVDQIFFQTRSICHDPRVRFDSASRSPRARARIFLQDFDIDQTNTTTPIIRSSQNIPPNKDALENIGSADFKMHPRRKTKITHMLDSRKITRS